MDTATASPPQVTRGAKLHNPLQSPQLGLDWIRCVGPSVLAPRVSNWLLRSFGRPEPVKGRYRFGSGKQYPNGALIFEDHADGLCCVEFNGETLSGMLPKERIQALRRLKRLGFRCTRVDIAADFRHEDGVGLVASMSEACHAGHLTGARTFEEIRRESGGQLAGWTVYAGRRGKAGSGRLVRAYDKGLQTRTAAAGQWERYEVEFTGEVADKAANAIIEAKDWTEPAVGLAFGAIDFRERRGVSRSLLRRPRCAWWERVIRSARLRRVTATRETPTLETWALWMRRAVAPMLESIARQTGETVQAVWEQVVGVVPPSASPQAMLRAFEFRRFQAA